MYQYKDRCKQCKYGFLPDSMDWLFENKPACLYFHDTGKHRDGDDEICNSFKLLTKEEIEKHKSEGRASYEQSFKPTYY